MFNVEVSEIEQADRKEILRYAGVPCDTEEYDGVLAECLSAVQGKTESKVCACILAVSHEGDHVVLDGVPFYSETLAKYLIGCERVCLFAATLGIEMDRLIRKQGSLSSVHALFLQAIGAQRVEALCDAFCRMLAQNQKADGFLTKPRISPGYGDLALSMQKDIFSLLDCTRKMGLTLTDSFLMVPTKSVTAFVGMHR